MIRLCGTFKWDLISLGIIGRNKYRYDILEFLFGRISIIAQSEERNIRESI